VARRPELALADLKRAVERQAGAARQLADELRREANPHGFGQVDRKLEAIAAAVEQLSVDITAAVNAAQFEELGWLSNVPHEWVKPIAMGTAGVVIGGIILSQSRVNGAQSVAAEQPVITSCIIDIKPAIRSSVGDSTLLAIDSGLRKVRALMLTTHDPQLLTELQKYLASLQSLRSELISPQLITVRGRSPVRYEMHFEQMLAAIDATAGPTGSELDLVLGAIQSEDLPSFDDP